jgi:uncharacterized membrane protein YfcA
MAAGGSGAVLLAWLLVKVWAVNGQVLVDLWTKRLLAALLLATAAGLLLTNRNGKSRAAFDAEKRPGALFVLGVGAGLPVALTSAGSGSLLVPALTVVTRWDVPQLAAASNLFGWVVGALSVAVHIQLGYFDWPTVGKVGLGLFPGVVAGALLSRRIERRWFVFGATALSIYLAVRLLLD